MQDYGPVNLDSVDALTLNWNQIQWLVKDQIKEVEELREEHNELYNEVTRCFGNERCLAEFELLDMSPGSKLHGLGLRALDLSSSAMSRMREEVLETKARLDREMRERWTMDRKIKEDQASLASQQEALARAEAKRVASSSSSSSSIESSSSRGSSSQRGGSSSSSSSSSSWSSSSSSYSRASGGGQAQVTNPFFQKTFKSHSQGQSFFGRTSPINGGSIFSNVNTTYGQSPVVYEQRYRYSQSRGNSG